MVRKGEIACYKQFLLFPQSFPQLHIFSVSKCGIVWYCVVCVVIGLSFITQSQLLLTLKRGLFGNIVEKGENAGNQHVAQSWICL